MGMLTDFQLVQMNAERNKGDPIIICIRGAAERRAGGKHASTLPGIIGIARGLAVAGRGTRNMNPSEDGVRFGGTREFQLVKRDLIGLGITQVDEKHARVLHSGMVYRVTAQQWLDRERVVRYFTERTMDDYPTLEGKWDFEDDVIGADPADCTITEPTGTTANVALDGTNVLSMTSAATQYPQAAINVLDKIEGPAVTVEFDIKVTGPAEAGIVARIVLGEATKIADITATNVLLYMLVTRTAGVLHLADLAGALFDKIITAATWVHVKVAKDTVTGMLSVEADDDVLADDIDVSDNVATIKHVLFTGNAGSSATINIDDVEVDCVAR